MFTLKKLFFCFISIVIFNLLLSSSALGAVSSNLPKIRADGAILIDAQSGNVLFEHNGFRSMHPASLTKIMTAILAIEKGNLNNQVTISEGPPKIYIGSLLNLKREEIITLGDLVKGALIISANDSTVAISEHIGGTQELFIQWMNQKAQILGAYKTRFINANGYSKPNHRTTPYDLALISRYAMQNRTFANIVRTKEAVIQRVTFRKNIKNNKEFPIKNTNKLLWHSENIVGIKTGTTARAGGCLIAAAVKDGHMLISVVLHTKKRYQDSLTLIDYGFDNFVWHERVKAGEIIGKCKVKKGNIKEVNIVAEKGLFSITPANEKDNRKLKIIIPKRLKAPFSKGKVVGKGILYHDNKIVDQINLVTENKAVKD